MNILFEKTKDKFIVCYFGLFLLEKLWKEYEKVTLIIDFNNRRQAICLCHGIQECSRTVLKLYMTWGYYIITNGCKLLKIFQCVLMIKLNELKKVVSGWFESYLAHFSKLVK